jgi:hypothetical protein
MIKNIKNIKNTKNTKKTKTSLSRYQQLYSPNKGNKKPKTETGFANASIARKTLKNIKQYDLNYQKQVVITMYNRAKYHPHHNQAMQTAMNVYKKWMKQHNIKYKI